MPSFIGDRGGVGVGGGGHFWGNYLSLLGRGSSLPSCTLLVLPDQWKDNWKKAGGNVKQQFHNLITRNELMATQF